MVFRNANVRNFQSSTVMNDVYLRKSTLSIKALALLDLVISLVSIS